MIHKQQVMSRREGKLKKCIGNVLSLADLTVFGKVKRDHSKVLADYPNGINFGGILLVRNNLLVSLICIGINFVHVGQCDVVL